MRYLFLIIIEIIYLIIRISFILNLVDTQISFINLFKVIKNIIFQLKSLFISILTL